MAELREADRALLDVENRFLDAQDDVEENTIAKLILSREDVTAEELAESVAAFESAMRNVAELRNGTEALVTQAILRSDFDDAQAITEAALMAFVFEARKALGPSYANAHKWALSEVGARVPSLPECDDLIEEEVLYDLSAAVVEDDRAAYVASMAKLVRSVRCSSLEHALALNSALAIAYEAALGRFTPEMKPYARRVLISSLANVFLVVHDLTKHTGTTALGELLRANRIAVGEVLAEPASPLRLAGFWLYERASDRLVQIKHLCEAVDEKSLTFECISGAAIVDSLIDPHRLGFGNCDAAEMATPMLDDRVAYICQKHLCLDSDSAPTGISALLRQTSGRTQFGASFDKLRDLRCPGGTSGSGWSESGGGAGGIGGALPRDALGCVTSTIRSTSGRLGAKFACVAGVAQDSRYTTAYASDPNPGCEYTTGGGDGGASSNVKDENQLTQAQKDVLDRAQAAAKQKLQQATDSEAERRNIEAHTGKSISDNDVNQGLQAIENKVRIVDDSDPAAWDRYCEGLDACVHGAGRGGALTAVIYVKESRLDLAVSSGNITALTDDLAHEGAHVVLGSSGATGDVAKYSHHQAMGCHMGFGGVGCLEGVGKNHRELCQPGVEGCLSPCDPSYAVANSLMDCLSDDEYAGEVFRAQCDPTVCDPAPIDDTTSSQWASCFEELTTVTGGFASMACASAKCSDPLQMAQVQGGACQCGTRELSAGGSARLNECQGFITCAEGSYPVGVGGGCTCARYGNDPLEPVKGPEYGVNPRGPLYGF